MSAPARYHDTFDKKVGRLRVLSYGGGSPRWVRIMSGEDNVISNMTMEEARDLHYALGRLIEGFGD